MTTRKLTLTLALVGVLLLSGCVTTPYFSGVNGRYGNVSFSYGYRPPVTINPGYYTSHRQVYVTPRYYNRGHGHFIGGHRHFGGGHKHFIGGHRGGFRGGHFRW